MPHEFLGGLDGYPGFRQQRGERVTQAVNVQRLALCIGLVDTCAYRKVYPGMI